jgi:hypothetical protein
MPVKGGSVEDLRPFVNLGESSFVLLISYLAATLRDKGPYPGLAIMGAEGTAKSTLMRVIGKLVDPHKVPERQPPREARDLFIHAIRARLLSFGNVSHITDWLSDALCSLATGGGFATRELYTDTEEILFDAMRPFVLNGIEFVTRSDLADRLIYFKLPPIADQDRCTEEEFWEAFERQRPSILGGLLDVITYGLQAWHDTKSDEAYPRMADFARWAAACEGALWEPGTFAEAYAKNRNRANLDVIEGEAIATAILRLMQQEGATWSGTAGKLLNRLEEIVGEKEARRRHWPGSAPVLGARLRRIQERLRRVGIEVSYGRKGLAGTRLINIRQIDDSQNAVSPVSAVRTVRPQRDGTDGVAAGTVRRAVRAKPLTDHGTDSADSTDSRLQTSSNGAKPKFNYRPNMAGDRNHMRAPDDTVFPRDGTVRRSASTR